MAHSYFDRKYSYCYLTSKEILIRDYMSYKLLGIITNIESLNVIFNEIIIKNWVSCDIDFFLLYHKINFIIILKFLCLTFLRSQVG